MPTASLPHPELYNSHYLKEKHFWHTVELNMTFWRTFSGQTLSVFLHAFWHDILRGMALCFLKTHMAHLILGTEKVKNPKHGGVKKRRRLLQKKKTLSSMKCFLFKAKTVTGGRKT